MCTRSASLARIYLHLHKEMIRKGFEDLLPADCEVVRCQLTMKWMWARVLSWSCLEQELGHAKLKLSPDDSTSSSSSSSSSDDEDSSSSSSSDSDDSDGEEAEATAALDEVARLQLARKVRVALVQIPGSWTRLSRVVLVCPWPVRQGFCPRHRGHLLLLLLSIAPLLRTTFV